MKRFVSVNILEDEVEGFFVKLLLILIWEEVYFIRIYLELYENLFKLLIFEINGRKENWFVFFDIELYFKMRLV